MEQLIHITVAYSNAVLLAVLSNVSDFAKKLDLPIPQPITINQVERFQFFPVKRIDGVLTLTNGDRFWQHGRGYIDLFYGYKNYLMSPQDMDWETVLEHWSTNFWGQMNMTTNEVIEFARDALRRVGCDPKRVNADRPPDNFSGPFVRDGKTVPFCSVEWRDEANNFIAIDVNAEKKQIVRFSLTTTNFSRPDPKLEVVPELESDYQKRTEGAMFMRTNVPSRLPRPPPSSQ